MRAKEILMEATALDAALKRGWVKIRYVKLNGKRRNLIGTTNRKLYTYIFKTTGYIRPARIVTVWERGVGWRSLRRNRILNWWEFRL
jgi:WYL_2, Sm-like SH3 beta-barrel fold